MDAILAVDVGTSVIRAAVGQPLESGVEILGMAEQPSDGLDRGVIVDIDAVATRIADAVAEAQVLAGAGRMRAAYVTGHFGFTEGFNSQGSAAITGGRRGVTLEDIHKALARAREKKVPEDMRIVQTIRQRFRVDDVTGIQDPEGLVGHLLEVDAHLLALKQASLENLNRALQRAGLGLAEIVPAPYAASLAALSPEERENGIALIDIGGGTTDVAVHCDSLLQYTFSLRVGGRHITKDMARAFGTSLEVAEDLKRKEAAAADRMSRGSEEVPIPRIPPRKPAIAERRSLDYVVGARTQQIANEVLRVLSDKRLTNQIYAGLVLVGGTAHLEGLTDRFENQLALDARIGSVCNGRIHTEAPLGAEYTAVAGTLLHAAERRIEVRKRLGTGWLAAVRRVGSFAARCFAQFV